MHYQDNITIYLGPSEFFPLLELILTKIDNGSLCKSDLNVFLDKVRCYWKD